MSGLLSKITDLLIGQKLGTIADLSYFNNRIITHRTTRNNTMASGQAIGQISTGVESSMQVGDINIDELMRQAEKIGFDPELKTLIEGIDKVHTALKRKNLELSLLEIVAMESPDENISDLRQQLFTAVKLIHGDEIEELLNDDRQVNRLSSMVSHGGLLPDAKPRRQISEKETLKNGIVSRFRKYFNEYRQLRVEIKDLKKNWKRRNDGDTQYDMDCESSG